LLLDPQPRFLKSNPSGRAIFQATHYTMGVEHGRRRGRPGGEDSDNGNVKLIG